MVWPMQTLNKISLDLRRDISCSPDSVIELVLQTLDHSCRDPFTAEKKIESRVKKLTICTVWLNERTKISGAAPQLCGDSICIDDRPAAVRAYVNKVAETATPIAPPVRAAVVFIPDALPTLSLGTEPKIALWFGELKIAQPRPESIRGRMMRGMEESKPNEAMKNCAITIRPEPTVQRSREPSRSDIQPAMGATITMMTEPAIIIQPICEGEKWRMFCR